LIKFLLIHDKVLAGNNGEPVFIFGLLQAQYFSSFPRLRVDKFDRNFATNLESVGVKHNYLINLGDKKGIHFD